MSDPLSLVRKAIAAGESLALVDGSYSLGGFSFPPDTKTAFKRSLGADEHYHTLREIVFCYENAKLPLVGYRTNCLQEKLKALVEADRAALISYLRGETATCPQIDQQAVEAYVPPAPTSTRPKRKAEEISTVAPAEGTVTSADADRLSKLRSKFFPLYASKSSIYNIAGKDDFRSVLKIFNNTVLQRASESGKSQAAGSAAPAPSSSAQRAKPIIVVPSALTSVINMFNAKKFLEEGTYVKPEAAIEMGAAAKKVDVVVRRMGGQRVQLYKLIDDPTNLPPEEWSRIAAVFVTGQRWQFNRWRESDPVQLFQQTLATHLTLEGRPVDPTVLSWNCRVLKVDEFKDYVNAGVVSQFWLNLDDFIQRKKPHLASAPTAQS
eukprot:gene5502-3921_t